MRPPPAAGAGLEELLLWPLLLLGVRAQLRSSRADSQGRHGAGPSIAAPSSRARKQAPRRRPGAAAPARGYRSTKHSAQIKIDLFPQMRVGWWGGWGKMGGQAMKAGEIALAGPHTCYWGGS